MDSYVLLELLFFFGGGIAVMFYFGYDQRRREAREAAERDRASAARNAKASTPADVSPSSRRDGD